MSHKQASRANALFRARRRMAVVAFALMAMPIASPAAVKIYRCGNVFQDQPCPEPKPAEARPIERSQALRDTVPCSGTTKESNGRNDCAGKVSPETQPSSPLVQAKR